MGIVEASVYCGERYSATNTSPRTANPTMPFTQTTASAAQPVPLSVAGSLRTIGPPMVAPGAISASFPLL
jgi:hypothetical protein